MDGLKKKPDFQGFVNGTGAARTAFAGMVCHVYSQTLSIEINLSVSTGLAR